MVTSWKENTNVCPATAAKVPQTAKCLLELFCTSRVSSAGWSDCRFLHLLKRCSIFSPAEGKEYMELGPTLACCLLPLLFGSHNLLSAPPSPFPKCICSSLYTCQVAEDITSQGNNMLSILLLLNWYQLCVPLLQVSLRL